MRTPRVFRRRLRRSARTRDKARPQFGLEPLEPRILLSGDPFGLEQILALQQEQDGGTTVLVASLPPSELPEALRAAGDPPAAAAAGPVVTGINLFTEQRFVNEGPSTIRGGPYIVAIPPLIEGIPGQPQSGAVTSIAFDPDDAAGNRILIGTANGGVWRTTNATHPSDGVNNNNTIPTADGRDLNGDGRIDGADLNADGVTDIVSNPDPYEQVQWTPLTDNTASLSISSVAFSPTREAGQARVIYAGIGKFSSARSIGSVTSGILRSTDGGTTWQRFAGNTWTGTEVTVVLPTAHGVGNNQVVLIATRDSDSGNTNRRLGLWISTDGGRTFTQESGAPLVPGAPGTPAAAGPHGLIGGAITDLVVDPNDNTLYYAAVRQAGIFRGKFDPTTNAFTSWTLINTGLFNAPAPGVQTGLASAAQMGNVRLATHGGGANPTVLWAAVGSQAGQFVNVFRSANPAAVGASWTSTARNNAGALLTTAGGLTVDPNGGAQIEKHFAVTADPNNANRVYITGRTHSGALAASGTTAFGARIFVGDASVAAANRWTPLFGVYANATSPHADARALVFDTRTNTLLQADDGGLYRLRFPNEASQTATLGGDAASAAEQRGRRHWISLNGNLQVTEIRDSSWDPVGDQVIAGAQDNGVLFQFDGIDNDPPDGLIDRADLADERGFWLGVSGGDGVIGQAGRINATTSVRYFATNLVSFLRVQRYGAAGVAIDATPITPAMAAPPAGMGTGITAADRGAFFPYLVVNTRDANRFLLATRTPSLYETTASDRGATLRSLGAAFAGTPAGAPGNEITALVYGGMQGANARTGLIYAGSGSTVYVREDFGTTMNSVNVGGGQIRAIAVDPTDWRNAFAVTANRVFRLQTTVNGAGLPIVAVTDITGNIMRNLGELWSAAMVPGSGGQLVLAVGGTGGVVRTLDAFAGAGAATRWTEIDGRLPNAIFRNLVYDPNDNLLLASSLGRGSFTLRNASTAAVNTDELIIAAGPESTTVTISRLGFLPNTLQVSFASASKNEIQFIDAAALDRIEFRGGSGNDRLELDFSNGLFSVASGIKFTGAAGTDRLVITDDTGGTVVRKSKFVPGDRFANKNGVSVRISTTSEIVTAAGEPLLDSQVTVNVTPNVLATIQTGLQEASGWMGLLSGRGALGNDLPVLGDSLGAALAGVQQPGQDFTLDRDEGRALAAPPLSQAAQSILQRLFETGPAALSLDAIAALGSPEELRGLLDALDDKAGNVLLTQQGGVTRIDMTVEGPLGGSAGLDLRGLGGNVEMSGLLEVDADLKLHLVFGVDEGGFFIEPGSAGDAELVVSNLRIRSLADGGSVKGTGRIGFLGIDVTEASLTVGPNVRFVADIVTPGADPVTGLDDGKVRIDHLIEKGLALAQVGFQSDDFADDFVLSAKVGASALLPGLSAPLGLVDARVRLTWADLGSLENFRISAEAGVADDVLKFLDGAIDTIAEGVSTIGPLLDSFTNIDILSTKIPVLNRTLGEILGGDPAPVVYAGAAIDSLSELEATSAGKKLTLVLASANTSSDGIQAGDAVTYRGADGHDVAGTVLGAGGKVVVVTTSDAAAEPDRAAPSVRIARGGNLGDSLRASLGGLKEGVSGDFRIPTLQELLLSLADLLGIDAAGIDLKVTGTGDTRGVEFTLPFDPAALTYSIKDGFDLSGAIPGLDLQGSGNLTLSLDPKFRLGLGLRIGGSGLSAAERFYLVSDAAPEVELDLSARLDDPFLAGKVGFLGVELRENASVPNNQGIGVFASVDFNLTDPGAGAGADNRITLDEIADADLGDLVDVSLDGRLDIDGLELQPLPGLGTAIPAIRISLNGDTVGRFRNLSELGQVLGRIDVQGLEAFTDFSSLSGAGLFGLFLQFKDFLSGIARSEALDIDLPFVDVSLGEAVDLGALFDQLVTGPLQRLRLVADGALPLSGILDADAPLRFKLNGQTIEALVPRDATNADLDALVTDINTALAAPLDTAGLNGAVTVKRVGNRLALQATDSRVDSLSIDAGEALGFASFQEGTPLSIETLQDLIERLAGAVGATYDAQAKEIVLDLQIDQSYQLVNIPVGFSADLGDIADVSVFVRLLAANPGSANGRPVELEPDAGGERDDHRPDRTLRDRHQHEPGAACDPARRGDRRGPHRHELRGRCGCKGPERKHRARVHQGQRALAARGERHRLRIRRQPAGRQRDQRHRKAAGRDRLRREPGGRGRRFPAPAQRDPREPLGPASLAGPGGRPGRATHHPEQRHHPRRGPRRPHDAGPAHLPDLVRHGRRGHGRDPRERPAPRAHRSGLRSGGRIDLRGDGAERLAGRAAPRHRGARRRRRRQDRRHAAPRRLAGRPLLRARRHAQRDPGPHRRGTEREGAARPGGPRDRRGERRRHRRLRPRAPGSGQRRRHHHPAGALRRPGRPRRAHRRCRPHRLGEPDASGPADARHPAGPSRPDADAHDLLGRRDRPGHAGRELQRNPRRHRRARELRVRAARLGAPPGAELRRRHRGERGPLQREDPAPREEPAGRAAGPLGNPWRRDRPDRAPASDDAGGDGADHQRRARGDALAGRRGASGSAPLHHDPAPERLLPVQLRAWARASRARCRSPSISRRAWASISATSPSPP